MSEQFRTEQFDSRPSESPGYFPALPSWLAARLLREGEEITWVVAPRFSPSWERYITHPLLFVAAVALAVICVASCALFDDAGPELIGPAILLGLGIIIGSIFVLGIACGYFTRLVVTNKRLVIMQGYEVRHAWDLDALPRHLLRYDRRRGEEDSEPTIDLDAVRTMLGSSSTHFAESKTILNFGKELRKIKRRDDDTSR
jgi:hypothetical protein